MKALVMAAIVVGGAAAASNVQAQDRAALQRENKTSDELERRDQPVTKEDLRILERASEILSSAAVWNRHDTRECHPSDTTWSLFCALEKASREVLEDAS